MYFIGISFFLIIWYIISLFYSNLILPDPVITFQTLIKLFFEPYFWNNFFNTFLKSILGLFISLLFGIPLGFFMGLNKKIYNFFRPQIMFIQGAPVVSYISIAMLWFGIGFYSPIFVAFVVIFPTIVLNISQGISTTDEKLLNMSKIFQIKKNDVLKYIYIPSILPFIISTLKIISGTLWRAIVVGEFLGGSKGLGYSLALSKTTLNTEEVFAYTIFLIIMGIIFEKIILKISFMPKIKIKFSQETKFLYKKTKDIYVKELSKKFESEKILNKISFNLKAGEILTISGNSGCGKTTILNIVSHILSPSSGIVDNDNKSSFIFQDDRLIPWLSVKDNIRYVNKEINNNDLNHILNSFNLSEHKNKIPSQLSGGLSKRVNIARAIAYNPNLIIMDEPFSSLDIKTKNNIIEDFIKIQKEKKFSVLFVSHDPYEISRLTDKIIFLSNSPAKIINSKNFKPHLDRTDTENKSILNDIFKYIINL